MRARLWPTSAVSGVGDSTFYRWKAKYDGLEVDELKRLEQLEERKRRLKQIVAGPHT